MARLPYDCFVPRMPKYAVSKRRSHKAKPVKHHRKSRDLLLDIGKLAANPSVGAAAGVAFKHGRRFIKNRGKSDKNVGVKEIEGHVGGTVSRSWY